MTIPIDTYLSSALQIKFEIDDRLCVLQHKTRPIVARGSRSGVGVRSGTIGVRMLCSSPFFIAGRGRAEGEEQGLSYRAFVGAKPELWSMVKAGLEKRCMVCHRTKSAGWHGRKEDWAVGVGQ